MRPRADNLYVRTGIYGVRNKVSGKVYIGQTTYDFGDRRDYHFSRLRKDKHPVKEMQKDYNEVGGANFEFIVLHDLQDGELIDELEREFIAEYKAKGLSYNAVNGGRKGFTPVPHSPEVRKHIGELNSIRMKGSKLPEEQKKHMSEAQKARFQRMTEEEKEAVRERLRVLGESHRNKKWTEEQRQAMRDEQKTKPRGAKYTIEQVKEMRHMYENKHMSITEIAHVMEIPRGTVDQIVNYRRWKYIS